MVTYQLDRRCRSRTRRLPDVLIWQVRGLLLRLERQAKEEAEAQHIQARAMQAAADGETQLGGASPWAVGYLQAYQETPTTDERARQSEPTEPNALPAIDASTAADDDADVAATRGAEPDDSPADDTDTEASIASKDALATAVRRALFHHISATLTRPFDGRRVLLCSPYALLCSPYALRMLSYALLCSPYALRMLSYALLCSPMLSVCSPMLSYALLRLTWRWEASPSHSPSASSNTCGFLCICSPIVYSPAIMHAPIGMTVSTSAEGAGCWALELASSLARPTHGARQLNPRPSSRLRSAHRQHPRGDRKASHPPRRPTGNHTHPTRAKARPPLRPHQLRSW